MQFAPRHEVVADELARVCRPGGRIGLVNWTPEGQIGELLQDHGPLPAAAAGLRLAAAAVGQRGARARPVRGRAGQLEFARGLNPWQFDSPEHCVVFMETHYGPTLKARERLTAEGRWEECRGEILAIVERRNEATDGSLLMHAEYLVAVGHKA